MRKEVCRNGKFYICMWQTFLHQKGFEVKG